MIPNSPPGQGPRVRAEVTVVAENTCSEEVPASSTAFHLTALANDHTILGQEDSYFEEPVPARGRRTRQQTVWCDPDRVAFYRAEARS